MSDVTDLLVGSAVRIFDDLCTVERVDSGWSPELWHVLEKSGLTTISVPESAGGSGGDLRDAASLLRVAGQFAAPVPLAETILAASLLAELGVAVPKGPLTLCLSPHSTFRRREDDWHATGNAKRVPWANSVDAIVVVGRSDDGEVVGVLSQPDCDIAKGRNIAGEPRDDIQFETSLDLKLVAEFSNEVSQAYRLRATLLRVALITGAAERAFGLSLSYAKERRQFGHPIGHFQAVQQQVAEMAGEVLTLVTAGEAALEHFSSGDVDRPSVLVAVAAAKAQANRTSNIVTRIAHQMHGALGFTREHRLRLSTTRLWSWRDEWGSETEWWTEIGLLMVKNPDEVWSTLASFE